MVFMTILRFWANYSKELLNFFTAIAIILGILFLVLGVIIVLFFRALVDTFIAGVSLKHTFSFC
jgi:hypothetical protein